MRSEPVVQSYWVEMCLFIRKCIGLLQKLARTKMFHDIGHDDDRACHHLCSGS